MSSCHHPASALFQDIARGSTYCTLCGDCVEEQQFELDPVFERGAGGGGGGRGGNQMNRGGGGTAAGTLRGISGGLRPGRSVDGGLVPVHNPRQTIEAARLQMANISRSIEIDGDTVEIALGIYRSALLNRIISGTRSVVIRACLYAACRRQRTPHIIYDFTDDSGDSPHAILSHMKMICEGTNTEVPVVDPSGFVETLAKHMDLGERTTDVVVCALKVLRAMRDDWISIGRRPMGVCAAALLVGCFVFNIPRTPEQVCGFARLTAHTITRRLTEFSATPAAELTSIDDYAPSGSTLPPAFNDSSRKSTEEDMGADMRHLSALYYELVAEAKTSTPATAERCDKWRRFLLKHCELEGQTPNEENLDLAQISPQDQLRILGLPNTTPIPLDAFEESVKREEAKISVKMEEDSQRVNSQQFPFGGTGDLAADAAALGQRSSGFGQQPSSSSPSGGGFKDPMQLVGIDYDDPEQFGQLTARYKKLLQEEPEVHGLHEEFDFADSADDMGFPRYGAAGDYRLHSTDGSPGNSTQNAFDDAFGHTSMSPFPNHPGAADAAEKRAREMEDEARIALEEILRDRDRQHALPWEILVLQEVKMEDSTDLAQYLVLDNEERMRREKVGQAMYKAAWDRGRPRTAEEIQQLEDNRTSKKRRRQLITEPQPVSDALQRALNNRGASTIDASQIDQLIPGLYGDDDGPHDEWE